tara:strand:- start:4429 stop:4767 length:339 start_codon:yes stop_codon:yes gene_type:complete
MLEIQYMVESVKIIATVAIFFIWFIRYDNIKKEFFEYGYPTWFRDLVGILKISFSIMLHSSLDNVVAIGSIGIATLMSGAVLTHIKVKSNFRKYIASVAMLSVSAFILFNSI